MSIDPKILKRMQGDDTFVQAQTKSSRRIKLERGQNMVVRFLPARLGSDGLWYAMIAKHWINKVPVVCPRLTAVDFGGDPEWDCPDCSLADELNDSGDEVISKFGYKSKANVQFFTYCVLFEKNGNPLPLSEVLNPYEFNHYRSTWEELKGFYIAGGRSKSPDSVLDYKTGNEFSINKSGKGVMRLDKLDSSPIFDLDDPKWADHIKRLEAAMKNPKVVIPTDAQLHLFARKLQEAADRGGLPGDDTDDSPRRSRTRRFDDDPPRRASTDDDDNVPYDDDATPARPATRTAPRRPAEPEDTGGAEEPAPRRRQVDPDETTVRRRPVEDDPPRRRAPVTPSADEDPPRRSAPPARRPAEDGDGEPVAPARDPEPADPGADGDLVDDPRPAVKLPVARGRALPPTERQAAARREPAQTPQGEAEDDDPLPEDDRDPVPPAPPAPKAPADDDTPPPVAATRKGSSQADVIRDRLSRLEKKA